MNKPTNPATRRRELVAAACDLIIERGLEGLRTRDIAARVGINVATLHHYFPTKQSLVLSIVQTVSEQFQHNISTFPTEETSNSHVPWNLLRTAESRDKSRRLETIAQETMLRARRDETVRRVLEGRQGAWHLLVEERVARGIRDGQFEDSTDAAAAADLITSIILGTSMLATVNPERASAGYLEHVIAFAAQTDSSEIEDG